MAPAGGNGRRKAGALPNPDGRRHEHSESVTGKWKRLGPAGMAPGEVRVESSVKARGALLPRPCALSSRPLLRRLYRLFPRAAMGQTASTRP